MDFAPTSRYHDIETREHDLGGRIVTYKAIRAISQGVPLTTHRIDSSERIDQLGHQYFGDADQWWRIADANVVQDPAALTAEPGVDIIIPTDR